MVILVHIYIKVKDRCNNCVDNLEWCTAKENVNHSVPYRKRRNSCKHGTYGYGIRRRKNGFEVGIDKLYLGRFKTYEEAVKVRDDYLKMIEGGL